jgi:hypothetical protein
MSTTLGRISPQASELLRIAVRGQHIERWTSPRKAYVEGRVGYLKWRKDGPAGFPRPPPWRDHGGGRLR